MKNIEYYKNSHIARTAYDMTKDKLEKSENELPMFDNWLESEHDENTDVSYDSANDTYKKIEITLFNGKTAKVSELDEQLDKAVSDSSGKSNIFDCSIGWCLCAKSIEEVAERLKDIATIAHLQWIVDMRKGIKPNEDVSPGEGFLELANVIEKHLKNSSK